MFFRIVIACIVIVAGYALYEIMSIRGYYKDLREPMAEFTVREERNQPAVTIVEFLNYDCGFCKDTHLTLLDYAGRHGDVRLVVRPVPYANGGAEDAAERALAAGLQGKFWDMDRALTEYKGELNDKFYRESAALYDIDYGRMMREAGEETVQAMTRNNAGASIKSGIERVPAMMIGKTIYQLDKPLTMTDLIRMVREEQNR